MTANIEKKLTYKNVRNRNYLPLRVNTKKQSNICLKEACNRAKDGPLPKTNLKQDVSKEMLYPNVIQK